MLRKVDKERLPENLRNLLPENNEGRFIVIGETAFEMCQMSFRDIKSLEAVFKEVLNKFMEAKSAINSVEDIATVIVESEITPEVLRNMYEVSEEDLNKLTLPQLVHAVNTFMDINFFSLPSESVEKLQQIISFFISTVMSYNLYANNTMEETPGVKEEQEMPSMSDQMES